jgi:hypothetical protein
MKKNKEVDIKARITCAMRDEIKSLADQRGETMSLVLREALGEYLERKRHGHILRVAEDNASPYRPKTAKKKKRSSG